MSELRDRLDAALAMARRDFLIFTSYRFRLVTMTMGSLFTLTLFHFLSRLVRAPGLESSGRYFAFVVVGLVIVEVLTSTMALPPVSLRQELVAGTFERLLVSPFGAVGGMAATLLFPFCLAAFAGVTTVILSTAIFGLSLDGGSAFLAIPYALLGALAFAPFGLVLLAMGLLVKQTVMGASFIVSGISLVAGIYFPISILPGWLRWASDVQPFTPATDLLRHALTGTALLHPAWLEMLKLVGFAAVGLPVALMAVRASVRRGRRSATILEF
ncbi:MAG: transporter permease [Solirubrobacterales bacterium]|nr:transporter permease [Solirubrobacterales bacterium]